MRSFYLQSVLFISSILFSEVRPGQYLKCKNEQRAITTNELRFFCTALLFNEINLPTKLLVDISFEELYTGQISKCYNEQRAITPK
jgi:hypothetical protein